MAGQLVALVGGLLVILLVVVDAAGTLLVTQGRAGWWRPTRLLYASTWPGWRYLAHRLPDNARERFLSLYGPLSILLLFIFWLAALLVGWALLYFGVNGVAGAGGSHDFASLVYFSASALVTAGLAGPAPAVAGIRAAMLVEALTGLFTVVLFIAYLPGVFAAYNRREARLLTLDDPSGRRITPVAVLTLNAPDGDLGRLCDFFAGWELWVADVLESHTAYPVLSFFRSRHPGQSWATALAALIDAAALACAVVPGAEEREPLYMYRRGRRAVHEISSGLGVPAGLGAGILERDRLRLAYSRLVAATLPARDFEDAWRRLQALNREHAPPLEALLDFLAAPRTFWGHSEESVDAVRAAR
jgi:hypothetical protein